MVGFSDQDRSRSEWRRRHHNRNLSQMAAIRNARILNGWGIEGESAPSALSGRPKEMLEALQASEAQRAADAVTSTFVKMQGQCESEIEKMLLLGLVGQSVRGAAVVFLEKIVWGNYEDGLLVNSKAETGTYGIVDLMAMTEADKLHDPIVVLQQVPLAGYRVDFLLFGTTSKSNSTGKPLNYAVVVECDGHDYHERTKEQAERDRKRDRAMMMLGVQVMRFTGSEIWKDPDACAAEALEHIYLRQAQYGRE